MSSSCVHFAVWTVECFGAEWREENKLIFLPSIFGIEHLEQRDEEYVIVLLGIEVLKVKVYVLVK